MKITFYGVRGSIPSPGSHTVKYGGNTPCVLVEGDDKRAMIIDAGTGIRALGQELLDDSRELYLLQTHLHWDHIHGIPFFQPLFQKHRVIHLLPACEKTPLALFEQMQDRRFFPLTFDDLPAAIKLFQPESLNFQIGSTTIFRQRLNHPEIGYAYRFDHLADDDKKDKKKHAHKIAFITDNELNPPEAHHFTPYTQWVNFCQDVDILVHDAMFTNTERMHTYGWGHSLVSQTLQLALDAKVKTLVLYHHAPDRTDEQLEAILAESQTFIQAQNSNCQVLLAREGETLSV